MQQKQIYISHVDTSSFALITNLANLKTKLDKFDIDKLVPVRTDLSKLSNVVKNDAIKNVTTKINFDAKIIELENNIKNYKHLIRAILEVKVILKKMVYKII